MKIVRPLQAPPVQAQAPPLSEELLFKREMQDVEPLSCRGKRLTPPPPPADSWKRPDLGDDDAMVLRDLTDLISGRGEFDFSATDECVEAHVKGFPPALMNQLRQGRIPFQDHLDLHGLTLEEAEKAIFRFITRSSALGRTCLLLIHGRGHRSPDGIPIIKRNLENLLLRKAVKNRILAFTTAKPVDGGSGASYILLRP
ncbi:MAG: Smr/MutS family protein [Deltaproteobacteria bacterium]|nr:Smr/MutS family protein [Deltaproteobacteria bacterium]